MRVGIDAGEAVAREGDYFGMTVNRSSRIAAAAGPGEILVAADLLDGSTAYPMRERRIIDLKGIAEPVAVATIDW